MRVLHVKWICALTILAVIVVASVCRLVLVDDPGEDMVEKGPESEESLRAQSVQIWRFGPDGQKQWEFSADSVSVGDKTVYRGISDGKLYSESGFMTFRANEVIHDESTGNLVISGDVVLSESKGSSLSTSQILWNGDESSMTCPEPVHLEADDVSITGNTMVGSMDTGVLEISGEVKVAFASGGVLTAQRVMYNINDGSSSIGQYQFGSSR